jgi:hypothetical protein
VEGPACKIKETEGLFNFYASVDQYATGLTSTSCGSGPSVPNPTAGDACVRLGGGARWCAAAPSSELARKRLQATDLHVDCTYA